MPDIKFSQLPSATLPLAGSETIPLLQGGTNVRVPIKTRSAFVIFAGAAAAAGDRPNNRSPKFADRSMLRSALIQQ